MKISYDPEVDAMYIQLVPGEPECRTVRLTSQIALDMANLGEGETLAGIEILDASEVLGKDGVLPDVVVQNLRVKAA